MVFFYLLVLCRRRQLRLHRLHRPGERRLRRVDIDLFRDVPHLGGRPAELHLLERRDFQLEHPVQCHVCAHLLLGRVSLSSFVFRASLAMELTRVSSGQLGPGPTATGALTDTRMTSTTEPTSTRTAARRSITLSENLAGSGPNNGDRDVWMSR